MAEWTPPQELIFPFEFPFIFGPQNSQTENISNQSVMNAATI